VRRHSKPVKFGGTRKGHPYTFFLFFFAFPALSCGYRPLVGTVPGGGRDVVIPTAENNTAYVELSGPLTAALRRSSARYGLTVAASDSNAARLRAVVVAVNGEPGMLKVEGKSLVPLDKVWRIDVDAELFGADGAVLVPKKRFSAEGRAFLVSTPDAEEALGQERRAALVDEIADAIVSFVFVR